MKKLLCIIIVCIIPFLLLADITPSDKHPVHNCVKITNLDDYQEIAMLGFIIGPMYDSPHFFEIKNDDCLEKGYKFNDIGLYWAQKKYVDSVGIDNIVLNTNIGPELYGDAYFRQVTNDPNIFFITSALDPGDFWVDDLSHLKSQISDYEIAGFIGDEIVIYLAKQIQKYDNSDDKTKIFDCPDIPNIKWLPTSFGDSSSSESQQEK